MTSNPRAVRPIDTALLLFALTLGSAAPALAADAAPSPVPTVAATAGAAPLSVEMDGVLQAVRQATVTAQVGGNVLALRVKAGDTVK
ncbi:MAG: efflux RND transporter periplasmic adaptor subunit, partial [Rhizobacter sp.]|nr:efflux RND transporter periplasmic adaptor subunit [Rhizobacter sp.]